MKKHTFTKAICTAALGAVCLMGLAACGSTGGGTGGVALLNASYSLGATRFETIKVVIRQIAPGIATATLLSIGRAIGDAAAVLFTAGYTDSIPTSLGQPAATLPLAVFFQLSSPIPEVQERAYAAALMLTVIVLVLSLLGRIITNRFSKNKI